MVIVATVILRMLHLVTNLVPGLTITDLPVVIPHHNLQCSWPLVPGAVSRCQDAGAGDDGTSTEWPPALLLGHSNLPWILVLESLLSSNYFGHSKYVDTSSNIYIQFITNIKIPVRTTT